MYMTPWARRAAARTPPVPGRWEPAKDTPASADDDVQLLVADGPGDGPEEQGELELAEDLSDLTPAPAPAPSWPRLPATPRPYEEFVGVRVGPTPLAGELRRDRDLLLAANGRLVARVRALEAQLRGHGIEPVARE